MFFASVAVSGISRRLEGRGGRFGSAKEKENIEKRVNKSEEWTGGSFSEEKWSQAERGWVGEEERKVCECVYMKGGGGSVSCHPSCPGASPSSDLEFQINNSLNLPTEDALAHMKEGGAASKMPNFTKTVAY